jgi:hypothetical protein
MHYLSRFGAIYAPTAGIAEALFVAAEGEGCALISGGRFLGALVDV